MQLPINAGWQDAPLALADLAEVISTTQPFIYFDLFKNDVKRL